MSVTEFKTMSQSKIIWENNFIELHDIEGLNAGIAIVKSNYIPIENFKESFLKAKELAKDYEWKYFIFDKSELDTFHQPSMEWYYTEWKQNLIDLGLNSHFKILPELPWFKISVDAGIEEIKKNNPEFDFTSFSVEYVNSIAEAIEAIKER